MTDPSKNPPAPDGEIAPEDVQNGPAEADKSADYPKRDRPLNDGTEGAEEEDVG